MTILSEMTAPVQPGTSKSISTFPKPQQPHRRRYVKRLAGLIPCFMLHAVVTKEQSMGKDLEVSVRRRRASCRGGISW